MDFKHVSVLENEAIDYLKLEPNKVIVDCTLGGAGHSRRIVEKILPEGRLIAIDQDIQALTIAQERLADFQDNIVFVHSNFGFLDEILTEKASEGVDGILFDLGVSSPQLDHAERGFSYMQDAPLDMRMDQSKSFSAHQLVNNYSEQELKKIIKEYGEENWASRIAKFIVEERKKQPIETTGQLVDIIKRAIPKGARREGPHPAKRSFQAIRIAVNDELGVFESAIKASIKHLRIGGRVAAISFHSLEDRIAKDVFKDFAKGCECPKEIPICVCNKKPVVKILTSKPIIASEEELENNPRARSAKLRVIEKIAEF